MKKPTVCCAIGLFFTSGLAGAITTEEVIQGIQEASRRQIADVDNYWIQRDNFGITSFEYYEKLSVVDPAMGGTIEYMRMVPPAELYAASNNPSLANASPDDLRVAADVIRSQGPRMEDGLRQEMANAELPPGIAPMVMNSPPGQPWLSANPNDMMGMYAMMLEGGAIGIEQQEAADAAARQEALNNPVSQLANTMQVTGEETLNGRPVAVLAGAIPPQVQGVDGQEFTMNSLSMWVDTEKFVTMKMRIEGEALYDGQVRPLALELEEFNHQPVPGCSQFEMPTSRVMRMSGMMTPEEEAQMSGQMAELQQQLDSMPPDQREMIMRQMGPQMAMLENMASGGGIEMVTDVTQMSCNTGLPSPDLIVNMFSGGTAAGGLAAFSPATAQSVEVDSGANLIRVIQNRLVSLGYAPGNTEGELDTATVVAITQFEAATQLPVTGEATPELAALLLQAIDGGGGGGSTQVAQASAGNMEAQQACLQDKIEAAQAAQQTRRGFGSLVSGLGRAAARFGNVDFTSLLSDINDANATAEDLAAAARDLGLTEGDIDECRAL